MTIYFYGSKDKQYGCFSNFSRYGFELDGLWWVTNEHYFQSQKFITIDPDWAKLIRIAKTPREAAKKGRNRSHPLRKDWEEVKDKIMFKGVLRKFETHTVIRQVLLDTGDLEIVENSPYDYYWGCGSDGTGKNKLGKILMEVRQIFQIQNKNI